MRLYRKVVQYLLSQHEKYFVFLGWALFILIGLLQIYKIKGGFITNYGADIIAPVMLYYTTRTKKTFLSELKKEGLNEKQTFTLLWFLCAGWEILQLPEGPLISGI